MLVQPSTETAQLVSEWPNPVSILLHMSWRGEHVYHSCPLSSWGDEWEVCGNTFKGFRRKVKVNILGFVFMVIDLHYRSGYYWYSLFNLIYNYFSLKCTNKKYNCWVKLEYTLLFTYTVYLYWTHILHSCEMLTYIFRYNIDIYFPISLLLF